MTMLECVHRHITGELQQGGRTDTVLVVTAVFFDLIMLAVNSIVASMTKFKVNMEEEHRRDVAAAIERRLQEHEACLAFKGWNPKKCPEPVTRDRVMAYHTSMHSDFYLILFALMTLLVNAVSILALATNRDSRLKLLTGLHLMYEDEKVDKYYDRSLLHNYSRRYLYFTLVIVGLASMSLLVPLAIRCFL
jgi:Ni/Fe-hydrogenase subunit HybB-like protein